MGVAHRRRGSSTEPSTACLRSSGSPSGYRHDSIPAGVQALTKLAVARGWALAATEDASRFNDTGLAAYNVVVFLSTTGEVLDDTQQAAFERYDQARCAKNQTTDRKLHAMHPKVLRLAFKDGRKKAGSNQLARPLHRRGSHARGIRSLRRTPPKP
jgi:hypothetical protein